jgi:GNAT superfamily N-acetyltransferase
MPDAADATDAADAADATDAAPVPRAPGYPAELERDVVTRTGQVVHVRPIRPADAPRLVAFHSALSPASVYLRFFSYHPVLTAREVERFTQVDYVERLALVVEAAGRLVAIGRYDRLAGTDEAEVAFIVDDDYQQQGIGTLLADDLARAARRQGVSEFVADTLAENSGMLEMFRRVGFPMTTSFQDGVVKVRLSIEPGPAYAELLSAREAARRVPAGPDVGDAGC